MTSVYRVACYDCLTMRMNSDQERRAGKLVAALSGFGSARSFWRVMRGDTESLPALRMMVLKEVRQQFQDRNVSIFVFIVSCDALPVSMKGALRPNCIVGTVALVLAVLSVVCERDLFLWIISIQIG